jgi:hypothetical protein
LSKDLNAIEAEKCVEEIESVLDRYGQWCKIIKDKRGGCVKFYQIEASIKVGK